MPAQSKHDYPALIAEYEQRLEAGEEHRAILADFASRGVNPGTFQNRRTQAKKAADTGAPKTQGKARGKSQHATADTERPTEEAPVKFPMDQITVDARVVQQRVKMSEETVKDYTELMEESESLPPVVLFRDGETYWLAEGFHRYYAAKNVGHLEIPAVIHEGSLDAAIDYACQANIRHGLRPTREDKAKAVRTQLTRHPERSDREIARLCGVSATTVGTYRKELYPPEPEPVEPQAESLTGVQLDTDHEPQTERPDTREPVQVDTSTMSHEPAPVSAPEDPEAPIRAALRQAQEYITAALQVIPHREQLTLWKIVTEWISRYVEEHPEGDTGRTLFRARFGIQEALRQLEPHTAPSTSGEDERQETFSPAQEEAPRG
jgi:hypothetical protein